MSMSDCPRCWDTPCTCGYMGYTLIRHNGPSQYDKDNEKKALEDRIIELEKKVKRLRLNKGKD